MLMPPLVPRSLRFASALAFQLALVTTPLLASSDRERFSHADWGHVLQRFVDERGFVDYEGLAKDRQALDRYVEALRDTGPTTTPELFPTRSDRLAYYLNGYNALVFAGVLERGPEADSVWKGGLISGYRFFVKRKWQLDGRRISLKALEDDLVRDGFDDPRIHAALNCASISCPRLPQEPFPAEGLDARLDAAMQEFVREERNLSYDSASGTVTLSKIFDWFERDFLDFEARNGGSSLVTYVNRYLPEGATLPLSTRVRFAAYDKGINAQPAP